MNQQYLSLLLTLAQLQFGQEVFYDTQSGQLLVYDKEDEAYYPIGPGGKSISPVWHYDRSRLLSAADLNGTENNGNFQGIFGTITEQNQNSTQKENSNDTDEIRNMFRRMTETTREKSRKKAEEQQQALFRYYSIEPFSSLYEGQIKSLALDIESLVFEILSNTTKKNTIEKVLKRYRLAEKLAEKADVYHLQQVRDQFRGQREQQENMQRVRQKMERKARRRRLRNKILGTIGFLIAFGLALLYSYKKYFMTYSTAETEKTELNEPVRERYWLIAGSYSNKDNALRASGEQATLLYDPDKKLWRVAVAQYQNLDSAKAAAKQTGLWILKH